MCFPRPTTSRCRSSPARRALAEEALGIGAGQQIVGSLQGWLTSFSPRMYPSRHGAQSCSFDTGMTPREFCGRFTELSVQNVTICRLASGLVRRVWPLFPLPTRRTSPPAKQVLGDTDIVTLNISETRSLSLTIPARSDKEPSDGNPPADGGFQVGLCAEVETEDSGWFGREDFAGRPTTRR